HAGETLLAKQRVLLDVDLRVERDDVPVACHDQRVDLEEARVALGEELYEARQYLVELLLLARIETEAEADPPGLVRLKARRGVKVHGEDLFRRLCRDLLDVHAAGGRRHDRDPLGGAIDEKAEIK